MAKNKEKAPAQVNGFTKLVKEVQALDVEDYGNWSKPIQVSSWLVVAAMTAFLGFTASTSSLISLSETEALNREALISTYETKFTTYSDATKYKEQLVEIEKKFNEQLQQLPKETEIPGLVDDLNRAAKQAGFKLVTLQLSKEAPKEFFIEQPIEIEASGNFHAFGKFVELVSGMSRIVTIKTFTAVESEEVTGRIIPETKFVIQASTYRYLDKQVKPDAVAQ